MFPILLAALLGCPPPPGNGDTCGLRNDGYFPFDELQTGTWQFRSTDTELSWELHAAFTDEIVEGDVRKLTMEHWVHCVSNDPECVEGEILRTLVWSDAGSSGIMIHEADLPGNDLFFDPPLRFADECVERGTVVESAGYTSSITEIEECPVLWNVDWPSCLRLELEGPAAGLAGTYWIVDGFSIVAMELDGDSGRWELVRHVEN